MAALLLVAAWEPSLAFVPSTPRNLVATSASTASSMLSQVPKKGPFFSNKFELATRQQKSALQMAATDLTSPSTPKPPGRELPLSPRSLNTIKPQPSNPPCCSMSCSIPASTMLETTPKRPKRWPKKLCLLQASTLRN